MRHRPYRRRSLDEIWAGTAAHRREFTSVVHFAIAHDFSAVAKSRELALRGRDGLALARLGGNLGTVKSDYNNFETG